MAKLSSVKRGKGSGNVINVTNYTKELDKQLEAFAAMVKEYMFGLLDGSGKHKIRRDKFGMYEGTNVEFTTDGVKIETPFYSQYVDKGRPARAKKIPIKVIIAWIKRYRVGGRSKTGKFRKNTSINSLSYAIQNSIYKKGITARPFLKQTLDYAESLIKSVIDEVLIPEIISIISFQ